MFIVLLFKYLSLGWAILDTEHIFFTSKTMALKAVNTFFESVNK